MLPDLKLRCRPRNQRAGTGTEADIRLNERNGEPEVSPHSHGQLLYDKGGRVIQQGKVSSKTVLGKWMQLQAEE